MPGCILLLHFLDYFYVGFSYLPHKIFLLRSSWIPISFEPHIVGTTLQQRVHVHMSVGNFFTLLNFQFLHVLTNFTIMIYILFLDIIDRNNGDVIMLDFLPKAHF